MGDEFVVYTLSILILNQLMPVGSRYGTTSFSVSPRTFGWNFGLLFFVTDGISRGCA